MQIDYHAVVSLTKHLTLLYAEDDPAFLEETREVFEELFLHVDTATNGEEALTSYLDYKNRTGRPYDLVITDINMPKMDGISLIKKIYEQEPAQSIIVISAHNESEYLLELVNMGIEQFLLKPNNYDTMLHVLHQSAKKIMTEQKHLPENTRISLGEGYWWDAEKSLLLKAEEAVKLTKNETLLVTLFVKNRFKISTLEEIFALLWPHEPHLASAETLKSIISRLRKKIPSVTIENTYGMGYRMIYDA